MKVALYVSELNVKGGTHKQVLRLAQHLQAQRHQVQIITAQHVAGMGYPEFSDLPILTLPQGAATGPFRSLRNFLRPARLAVRMNQADVVNIHDNRGLLFGFLAKGLGKGRRFTWQINDLDPAFKVGAHDSQERPSIRVVLQRLANRLWARRVDAITVNVGKNRERVQKYLGQESEVMFCGVDFPALEVPVKAAGLSFELLSTGVFVTYRNYETLVRACALANHQLENTIRLTIVGDTRYDPAYVERIRRLADSLDVNLKVRENLSQADLDRQIAESHAFAFVNIDQSWGLAVFEAAARTTPVILSKSVGACELVGGKPGFLMVDPLSAEDVAKAIVSLATDAGRLRDTALLARDTVKDMSWDRLYCEPVITMFERLIAE